MFALIFLSVKLNISDCSTIIADIIILQCCDQDTRYRDRGQDQGSRVQVRGQDSSFREQGRDQSSIPRDRGTRELIYILAILSFPNHLELCGEVHHPTILGLGLGLGGLGGES